MKKTIILTIAIVSMAIAASAQADKKNITVEGSKVELSGGEVSVDLDLSVGRRVARSGHTVVYRPYITDGTSRWTLPELVVRHARARVAEERHNWVSGRDIVYDAPTFVRNGDEVQYRAGIPYQPWMEGAKLIAESIDVGCCGSAENAPVVLAELVFQKPVLSETIVVLDDMPELTTTGEQLEQEFKFVLPASEFDRHLPQVMFDDDREGALKVYFALNSSVLDPFEKNNAVTLRQMLSAIRKLQASSDSRVAHIVVAGFASPEGSFDLNDRLAYNRAAALKEYIHRNTNLPEDIVHIYNGAEDWAGLRQMVEDSVMPSRERVLDIIDLVPVWDGDTGRGRENALQQLDGGQPYRYMLRNFFPELRKAAYIKIFYENQ